MCWACVQQTCMLILALLYSAAKQQAAGHMTTGERSLTSSGHRLTVCPAQNHVPPHHLSLLSHFPFSLADLEAQLHSPCSC